MNQFANNIDPNTSLDAEEAAGLVYMREEEKLAHDVYTTLYEQWGLPIFDNISDSEERHEDRVETLLDRYQIPDPADNNAIGVFADPSLQQLYDTLVLEGSQSLTDALEVGVLIEETDIVDLQERIAQTDNADIQQVYGQLLNGSINHLSAFNSSLAGETVDPLTGDGGGGSVRRGRNNSGNVADFVVNSGGQMNQFPGQNFGAIDPNLNGDYVGSSQMMNGGSENQCAIALSENPVNQNLVEWGRSGAAIEWGWN